MWNFVLSVRKYFKGNVYLDLLYVFPFMRKPLMGQRTSRFLSDFIIDLIRWAVSVSAVNRPTTATASIPELVSDSNVHIIQINNIDHATVCVGIFTGSIMYNLIRLKFKSVEGGYPSPCTQILPCKRLYNYTIFASIILNNNIPYLLSYAITAL